MTESEKQIIRQLNNVIQRLDELETRVNTRLDSIESILTDRLQRLAVATYKRSDVTRYRLKDLEGQLPHSRSTIDRLLRSGLLEHHTDENGRRYCTSDQVQRYLARLNSGEVRLRETE